MSCNIGTKRILFLLNIYTIQKTGHINRFGFPMSKNSKSYNGTGMLMSTNSRNTSDNPMPTIIIVVIVVSVVAIVTTALILIRLFVIRRRGLEKKNGVFCREIIY